MILVIRPDGEALNLTSAVRFRDLVTPTGPTHLVVKTATEGNMIVENFSVQELVEQSSGRWGPIVFRRYWRPEEMMLR